MVPGATRINVKMVEASGRVTDLNFPGVEVSDELLRFEQQLQALLPQIEYVVVAGSLPRGSPRSGCAMAATAGRAGQEGAVRQQRGRHGRGADGQAVLGKPNEHELADWAGQPLESLEALMAAAEALQARYQIPTWWSLAVPMGCCGAPAPAGGRPSRRA